MKKILFNDRYRLTDAVLGGRKTMTRRLITCQICQDTLTALAYNGVDVSRDEMVMKHSRYKVGEVVAVAQRYSDIFVKADLSKRKGSLGDLITSAGWDNKMFVQAEVMPKKIRITNVRIERLQDIRDEDCLREGIYLDETAPSCYQPFYTFKESQEHGTPVGYQTAREAFADLIDKISGKGTWDSNPWVFVYSFELIKTPEPAFPPAPAQSARKSFVAGVGFEPTTSGL